MRTAYVCALVASLLVFSGCGAINGPGGGSQWDGFCSDGSCNGYQSGGHNGKPGFGLFRSGGSQGCDSSGGCGSGGCGSGDCVQNFSDSECGPMCGAYLSDTQTGFDSCDCGSCEVRPSYVKGQFNSWFRKGISWPRPFAGVANSGCASGECDTYGGEGYVTPAGPLSGTGRGGWLLGLSRMRWWQCRW